MTKPPGLLTQVSFQSIALNLHGKCDFMRHIRHNTRYFIISWSIEVGLILHLLNFHRLHHKVRCKHQTALCLSDKNPKKCFDYSPQMVGKVQYLALNVSFMLKCMFCNTNKPFVLSLTILWNSTTFQALWSDYILSQLQTHVTCLTAINTRFSLKN